jgi:arginine decarboxylase
MAGLHIVVSRGTGTGPTKLAAFDAALRDAGVANFNLIKLSSVIPPGSTVDVTEDAVSIATERWGERLYVVLADARVSEPNHDAWAGIGWFQAGDGRGLFAEHEGASEQEVRRDLTATLSALREHRRDEMADPTQPEFEHRLQHAVRRDRLC